MPPLPSLFVSHGAPTFALEPGLAGEALAAFGRGLPAKPQAVLVVSPHWMTPELRVGTSPRPRTIHDFGGFDPALYDIRYPVDGHPALASRALEIVQRAGWNAMPDGQRGLDHGAWVPVRHVFPRADVPVFQVSLPRSLEPDSAYRLGTDLAPLSAEGVLIVGSGSLTHNLYEFRQHAVEDAAYAKEFAAWVKKAVLAGDHERLRRTLALAPHARRAHPTTEHFLPLLVAAGAGAAGHGAKVIEGGITHGVLAMDSFVFGVD